MRGKLWSLKVIVKLYSPNFDDRFRSITSSYYRSAHGVIIVYDITKRNTFLSLQKWINEVRNYTASNVVCALVGNKCDLVEEREVSTEEAEQVCDLIPEILFQIETSAKENTNIEKAFERIAEELMVRLIIESLSLLKANQRFSHFQNRQSNIGDEASDGIKLGQSKSITDGHCNC